MGDPSLLPILVAAASLAAAFACDAVSPAAGGGGAKGGAGGKAALAGAAHGPGASGSPERDDAAAESLGWRLAVQAWTFRDRTAFEAIDAARRLGLRYIELYPGQRLSPALPDAKVSAEMPAAEREALLARLREAGVRAVNFGVVGFSRDEEAARRAFDFARALGIETITCEPEEDSLDLVARLCDESGIRAAIHDHPKPSRYWSPEAVLGAVEGRTERLGACADTGHWTRSGLRPVECLRRLEGRIVTLHFKDVAEGEDRVWGTGDADARGMLEELRRQGFRGVLSIEHESGAGAALEADVARCIAFFDAAAREIARPSVR